jgi:hypothetical protein
MVLNFTIFYYQFNTTEMRINGVTVAAILALDVNAVHDAFRWVFQPNTIRTLSIVYGEQPASFDEDNLVQFEWAARRYSDNAPADILNFGAYIISASITHPLFGALNFEFNARVLQQPIALLTPRFEDGYLVARIDAAQDFQPGDVHFQFLRVIEGGDPIVERDWSPTSRFAVTRGHTYEIRANYMGIAQGRPQNFGISSIRFDVPLVIYQQLWFQIFMGCVGLVILLLIILIIFLIIRSKNRKMADHVNTYSGRNKEPELEITRIRTPYGQAYRTPERPVYRPYNTYNQTPRQANSPNAPPPRPKPAPPPQGNKKSPPPKGAPPPNRPPQGQRPNAGPRPAPPRPPQRPPSGTGGQQRPVGNTYANREPLRYTSQQPPKGK